tara:strand:+ start:440 stop:883 length:444 start_codon:yes stop_codon:yes gene_type:complete
MGCDIHGIVEIKIGDKWVGIKELKSDNQNYERFAQLASVRGHSDRTPNGIPPDASDMSMYYIEHWGEDGHSHSYMSLRDACLVFIETDTIFDCEDRHFISPEQVEIYTSHRKEYPADSYFGITVKEQEGSIGSPSIDRLRLVFWFDN